MTKQEFQELAQNIVLLDGATGSNLMAAGMPFIDDNGNAVYSMKAPDFARHVKALIDAGAGIVGGCCGTTPEYIREVAKMIGR